MRAAVLSFALTLALGQNASLVCAVRCHPEGASACEHQDETTSTPRVAGNDDCAELTASAAALLPEAVRPGSRSHLQLAVVVVQVHLLTPPVRRGFGQEPGHREPREARPLVRPLRI